MSISGTEGTISLTLESNATTFMRLHDVIHAVEQTYARYVLAASCGHRMVARSRLGVSASTLCRILNQETPKAHHVLQIVTRRDLQPSPVTAVEQEFMAAIPAPNAIATCLLHFFGVDVKREQLWRKSPQELGWMLDDARQNYLRLAKAAHPDHGGSLERMQGINSAWTRVEKIFGDHGVRRRC